MSHFGFLPIPGTRSDRSRSTSASVNMIARSTPAYRPGPPSVTVPPRERHNPYPWLLFGLLVLAFVYIWTDTSHADPTAQPIAAPVATQPPATIVVHAVLMLPTATITPVPTARPTKAPTAPPVLNWCGDDETPGTLCQLPPEPTATPTEYPSCARADPGSWCIVETRVSR